MTLQVAVTTSSDAYDFWAGHLTSAGYEPVGLPCIDIESVPEDELAEARGKAGGADLVVITSARAVSLVWPERGLDGVEVAAVGDATATAVTAAGGTVTVVGRAGAEALADRLVEHVQGRSVLYLHAVGAGPGLPERLRALGAEVESIPVYAAIPCPPGPAPVDVALFGSPSAVKGWVLSRSLDELDGIGAIGPTTTAELEALGFQPQAVPEEPSVEALVAELTRVREETS